MDICGSNVVFPQFEELYWFYKIEILHYYKHGVLVLEMHICSIVVTSLLFKATVILGHFNLTYFNIFLDYILLTNKKQWFWHFDEINFSKMCRGIQFLLHSELILFPLQRPISEYCLGKGKWMIVNILQINKYTVWKNARIICVTADDTHIYRWTLSR